MPLLMIEEAKAHLRIDHDFDDTDILLKLTAAEEQAIAFLDRKVYVSNAEMTTAISNGDAGANPMVVNASIKAAILLMLGHLYENREEMIVGSITSNLKYGFESLLSPYRVGIGI